MILYTHLSCIHGSTVFYQVISDNWLKGILYVQEPAYIYFYYVCHGFRFNFSQEKESSEPYIVGYPQQVSPFKYILGKYHH
jgi:hypothetical protein